MTSIAAAAATANPIPSPATTSFTPSRSPGGAITGVLNLTDNKIHLTFYSMAIKGLDPKFNGDPQHLMSFLASVASHATVYDWKNILTFGGKDFFSKYGTITAAEIRAQAMQYSGEQVTRESQNSAMLALFLQNSIDQDLYARLLNVSSEYTVNGYHDGPLMLKTIISLIQVATNGNAMALSLLESLNNLKEKLKEYDSIIEFNAYVRKILQTLENYGRKPDDSTIIALLFPAYLSVPDETFNYYIKTLRHACDHSTTKSVQTAHELMTLAEEQFKIQSSRNEWKIPSKTEAQILALKAKIEKKSKPDSNEQKSQPQTKAWREIPPAKGEPHTIKRGNRTYHWCSRHKSWVGHDPKDCKLKKTREVKSKDKNDENEKVSKPDTKPSSDEQETSKKSKATRFKAKLAEVIPSDSDSE